MAGGFRCGCCCGRFRCGHCRIHMTLMSLPRHLPGRRRTLCAGLKTKMDRLLDDGIGKGVVVSVAGATQLILRAARFFLFCFAGDDPAATFCCGHRCPVRCPWLNRPFDLKLCSLGDPPSGSQGPVPLKWTGCPRATALVAANRVRVRPCLAALHHVRI